jgi:tRNA dimethylallyltransferase
MNTLIVILGPTGVGKTDLCLHIAKHYNMPIINADSRQIFCDIKIGTAAPTKEQQSIVKHYFVGNHQITDYYSASMFELDVMSLLHQFFSCTEISNIQHDTDINYTNYLSAKSHDKILMAGGSMMYIDAVCNGIDDIPTIDKTTRSLLKQRYEEEGLEQLCEELRIKDPEYYKIVDHKNPKRVIHALEICLMTGKTYTSFRKNEHKKRPFNIIKIGLNRDREELYKRINQRVLSMIDQGLLEEAKKVYPLKGINALNTVGYKELFEHFDGKCTLEEAIFRIQCDTRKYCRKQLTWFRRDKQIRWFHPDKIEEIIKYIDSMT